MKVASVAGSAVDKLKPKTIFFNDHRVDETSDKGAFIRSRNGRGPSRCERQFLSLFPKFTEGMIHRIIDGSKKEVKDELQMYVTEARFKLSRPADSIDLKQLRDPAVHREHRSGDQAQGHQAVRSLGAEGREGPPTTRTRIAPGAKAPASPLCTRSSYKLEGKLPIGVALANKLRDSERKVSDTIEFESELRLLSGVRHR